MFLLCFLCRTHSLTWLVSEFALVLGHVGDTRYDILAKWPLKTV